MPKYLVVFSEQVVDQPDHPRVARPVLELAVNAPDPMGAWAHATRVSRGVGTPVAVYDRDGQLVWGKGDDHRTIPPPPAPLVESPDRPEVLQYPADQRPAAPRLVDRLWGKKEKVSGA